MRAYEGNVLLDGSCEVIVRTSKETRLLQLMPHYTASHDWTTPNADLQIVLDMLCDALDEKPVPKSLYNPEPATSTAAWLLHHAYFVRIRSIFELPTAPWQIHKRQVDLWVYDWLEEQHRKNKTESHYIPFGYEEWHQRFITYAESLSRLSVLSGSVAITTRQLFDYYLAGLPPAQASLAWIQQEINRGTERSNSPEDVRELRVSAAALPAE